MTIGLGHYLFVAAVLFTLGILGIFLNPGPLSCAGGRDRNRWSGVRSMSMMGAASVRATFVVVVLVCLVSMLVVIHD